jgi:NADH-quinone oxidoreductase subunit L
MNKFYIDELYNLIIVRPIKWISINVLWKGLDISLIDNVCVDGAPRSVGLIGKVVQVAQTGMVPHYIFFIVIGLSAMIVWLVL